MSNVKIEGNASGTGTFTIAAPNSNTDRTLEIPDTDGSFVTQTTGYDVSFYEDTGTTAKFFWDASAESLGIGTSSPAAPLHIYNADAKIRLQNSGSTGIAEIYTSNQAGLVLDADPNNTDSGTPIAFKTDGAERMRIDSSGNLLLATTSKVGSGRLSIEFNQSTHQAISMRNSNSGNGANYVLFRNSSDATAGIISQTGATSVNYGTSSDYRLKENWQPISGSIDRLKNLNPVNFAWKADGKRVDGFLAHEVQIVVPEAIVGEKDAVDKDGNPQYQSIDQAKLVPLLTAALQEAVAKIEALETRIAALEA
jgi:hypothetical protein